MVSRTVHCANPACPNRGVARTVRDRVVAAGVVSIDRLLCAGCRSEMADVAVAPKKPKKALAR